MTKIITMARAAFTVAPLLLAGMFFTLPSFAASRDFDLAAFTRIDASSGIGVIISPGKTQSVRVETKNNKDFQYLQLFVKAGELHASINYSMLDFLFKGGLFAGRPTIKVFITLPKLSEAKASLGADVQISEMNGTKLTFTASTGAIVDLSLLAYDAYALTASSGALIDGSGSCLSAKASATSGGHINIADLRCETAQANASSGASISLFASGAIAAKASSGARITIAGNPQAVDANTSSGGSIGNPD